MHGLAHLGKIILSSICSVFTLVPKKEHQNCLQAVLLQEVSVVKFSGSSKQESLSVGKPILALTIERAKKTDKVLLQLSAFLTEAPAKVPNTMNPQGLALTE